MKMFTYIIGLLGYFAMGIFLHYSGHLFPFSKGFWIGMAILVWVDWMASWHARIEKK